MVRGAAVRSDGTKAAFPGPVPHAALEKLLAAYPDEDATPWLYDKALWLILRRASNGEIAAALDNAIAANPYVPAFLLGRKALPRETPELVEFGGESEAAFYADQAKSRWVEAVGALEHLRQAVGRSRKARSLDENPSRTDA